MWSVLKCNIKPFCLDVSSCHSEIPCVFPGPYFVIMFSALCPYWDNCFVICTVIVNGLYLRKEFVWKKPDTEKERKPNNTGICHGDFDFWA